ncbi:MAG: 2-octaprenyl-6-methoxyphenyl hydroxylase [Cellvibrionaceae bacterium]
MTVEQSNTICIAGGGMVGASLALLLSKQCPNKQIVVLEAHPFNAEDHQHYQPCYDGRATALSYGTRAILESLGLWSSIESQVGTIKQIQVSDRGHSAATEMDAEHMDVEALGYVVENRWLGQQLMTALQLRDNITFKAPAIAEKAQFFSNGVVVTLQNGEELQAELLVVADGANSKLRQQCGIQTQRQSYEQCAVIAGVQVDRPHDNIAYERFTDWGPMALLPLASSQYFALVWTLPQEISDSYSQFSEKDFLEKLQQRFGYRAGQFTAAQGIASYPLSLLVANEQVRRRLVVMGNAAHSLHPVAGQGFNLSLRDATVLASCIGAAAAKGSDIGELSLLQRYLQLRESDQRAVIHGSDLMVKLFSSSSLLNAGSRSVGMLAMDMLPSLRNAFTKYAMGL